MTLSNFIIVLAGAVVCMVLAIACYMVSKGGWLLLKSPMRDVFRSFKRFFRSPRRNREDASSLIQLAALPFTLIYDQFYRLIDPENAATELAAYQRHKVAQQIIQSHLYQMALFRDDDRTVLCQLIEFEMDDDLVVFYAETVSTPQFKAPSSSLLFSVPWEYFTYDDEHLAANAAFMHWRVDFDQQKIQEMLYQHAVGQD